MPAYGSARGRFWSPAAAQGVPVPLSGVVTFTASTPFLSTSDATTFLPVETMVALDALGAIDVELVATDDPNVNPTGFTYLVEFSYMRDPDDVVVPYDSFSIAVPAGSVVDLTAVAPVPSSPGTPSNPGGTDVAGLIASAVQRHVDSSAPHPVYDDIPDLATFYANRKAVQ